MRRVARALHYPRVMKTLIASLALVLGASAAYAQPGYEHHDRWVTLSRASFGNDGRADIQPNRHGEFRQIQLASASRIFVSQVVIEFADGTNQVERDMNTPIEPGRPLTVDLAGRYRQINRVIVYGPQGRRVRGSVTLRGLD